jgi:predicted TIM-barrel fold metal-dependent hydrolase
MDASEIKVIDSDGHVLEPANLWQEYIDPKFRDQAPYFIKHDNGGEQFWMTDGFTVGDGSKTIGECGSIGQRDGEYSDGAPPYAESTKGGFDPHARIPDMDKELVDAVFLYPTLGLFLDVVTDPDQATANARAYNRWLADYCSAYPDRLHGVACLPLQSVEGAIQELRFCTKELGFRSAFLRPNPYNGRPLHHKDFDPVWEAAQELDIAVGIHGGGAQANLGDDRFPYSESFAMNHCVVHTFEMMAAAVSLIMGGVCERFPRLRIGFLEASGGWMPAWLDRMDRHFDDQGMNDLSLTVLPSEIFARQCYIAYEPVETTIAFGAQAMGANKILFATDYPHHDGFWGAAKMIKRLDLDPDVEAQVLGGGAKEFYGLA